MTARPASTARCAVVWTTGTAAAAGLAAWLLALLASAWGSLDASSTSFDRLLSVMCAAAALPAVAWLWLLSTAVVLEALRGVPRPVRGLPGPVRRAVLAACGAAVLTGLAVPADAAPVDPHQDRRPQTAAVVIAGLPLPDRAVEAPAAPDVVEVRPGDTLWDLARRDLGPDADDAEITTRWHEIYALNRGVIGPDPDLIQPAQRLRLDAG